MRARSLGASMTPFASRMVSESRPPELLADAGRALQRASDVAKSAPPPAKIARRVGANIKASLYRGRIIEAVRTLELNLQTERGNHPFIGACLRDESVDGVLHQ